MRRIDITPNGSGRSRGQPQLVPKGIDRFAPVVKVGGALPLLGPCHCLPSASMDRVDARCEGTESAVVRPPPFGSLSSLAELSIYALPQPAAFSSFHRGAFVSGQLTPRARERVLADEVRM